jgi:hypothetical protein
LGYIRIGKAKTTTINALIIAFGAFYLMFISNSFLATFQAFLASISVVLGSMGQFNWWISSVGNSIAGTGVRGYPVPGILRHINQDHDYGKAVSFIGCSLFIRSMAFI